MDEALPSIDDLVIREPVSGPGRTPGQDAAISNKTGQTGAIHAAATGQDASGPGAAPGTPPDAVIVRGRCPESEAEIRTFRSLCLDLNTSIPEIARVYRVSVKAIGRWRQRLAIPMRPSPSRAPEGPARTAQGTITGIAASARAAEARNLVPVIQVHPNQTAAGVTIPGDRLDPLLDPEVAELMRELVAGVRQCETDAECLRLQRLATRVMALAVAKNPLWTWDGLFNANRSLTQTLIMTRKMESEMPAPPADRQQLRREAAATMMRELTTVLSKDEQKTLAELVKLGADRLIAQRGAEARTSPAPTTVTREAQA